MIHLEEDGYLSIYDVLCLFSIFIEVCQTTFNKYSLSFAFKRVGVSLEYEE